MVSVSPQVNDSLLVIIMTTLMNQGNVADSAIHDDDVDDVNDREHVDQANVADYAILDSTGQQD